MAARTDWEIVKYDYITGGDSCAALARKYGIHPVTVQKKAKAGDWSRLRAEFRRRAASAVHDRAIERVKERQGDTLADTLAGIAAITDGLEVIVQDALAVPDLLRQKGRPDTGAIKNLTAAAKALYEVKKELQGLSTAQEEHRQQIERERIELERARVDLERERQELARARMDKEDAGAGVVRVIVGGYDDSWSE